MPANTQTDHELSLTLDGVEYACQVISGTHKWPGKAEATRVPVACGDEVSEPGDATNGQITGEVYKDHAAGGITRALITALETDAEMDYVWTENVDDTGKVMTVTGKCRVGSHEQTFQPDKYGRHPLDLTVTTATTAWS